MTRFLSDDTMIDEIFEKFDRAPAENISQIWTPAFEQSRKASVNDGI